MRGEDGLRTAGSKGVSSSYDPGPESRPWSPGCLLLAALREFPGLAQWFARSELDGVMVLDSCGGGICLVRLYIP